MNWADYLKGWLSLSFFWVQSNDYQELLGSYWQQVNFPHSCSVAFVCLFVCLFPPQFHFLSFSLQYFILDEDGTSAVIICALDECSIGFWMDQLVQLVFLNITIWLFYLFLLEYFILAIRFDKVFDLPSWSLYFLGICANYFCHNIHSKLDGKILIIFTQCLWFW